MLNHIKIKVTIPKKLVLGTAQFGNDYGITNINGKPNKSEVFKIITSAWEKGVRKFDTASSYGSESFIGEFIVANGLENNQLDVLTKIPSISDKNDYRTIIKKNIEDSLKYLKCNIDVLFFHSPKDSKLLLHDPIFFETLLNEYPITSFGSSVYDPSQIQMLSDCKFDLAFQFPFNVLDRRFEDINMFEGKRYARSIFLQGLLLPSNPLRVSAPKELIKLKKDYDLFLKKHNFNAMSIAIHFVMNNTCNDYFLVGVESVTQLEEIFNCEMQEMNYDNKVKSFISEIDKIWLDPRKWC